MRKFPPQLPGLFELNRNASGQQATPLAVPPAVRPPPPPPNTSGVSSVKSTANGASTNFHSQQAEQQRRAPDIEKSTVAATNTQANGAAIDEGLKSQRDNSKQFIMAWHDSGYTFDQLVAEGLDPTFLSGLYRELSLPIPSSDQRPAAPTRGPQATVVSKQQALPPKPPSIAQPTLPPINTQKSNAVPAAAQAHVSKPVDHLGGQSPAGAAEKAGSPAVGRQDYIARLMAAKTKKANAASPTSRDQTPMDAGRPNPSTRPAAIVSSDPPSIVAAPQQTAQPSVTVARPIDASTKPQITQNIENASRPAPPQRVPSASEQAMAEAKKKAQTALAKERMAALARNKASKNAPMPTVPTLPPRADGIAATNGAPVIRTTAQSTLPVQTQPATHRSSLSTSATPAPPVHQRATPVSRIPGLSTLSPQIEALPDKSGANLLLPQKPVATILRPASESKPASARLIKSEGPQATDTVFGQGPQPGAVAPVVIELSDDEDDAPKTAKRATKDLAPPKPIGEKATATPSPSISTSKKPAELKSQVSAPESSESSVVLQNPNATTDQVQNPQQLRSLEIRKRLAELELRRKQKAQENKPQGPTSVVKPTSGKPPASSQLGDRIAEAATNAKDTDTPPPAKKLKTNAQDTVEQMSNELQPPNADDSADPQSQDNISSASKPLAESNSMRQDHPRSLSKEPGRTLSTVDHGKGESTPASTPNPKAINPKSRRRTEIQTKLPAIEASFANNTSRLEVLRAQMREIEESLKREQEDRDKLVAELESLGVDTEGMDHAELRETRDEIMAQAPTDDDVMDRDQHKEPNNATVSPNLARSITHSTAASMSISSPEEVTTNHRPVGQSSLDALARLRRSSSLHSRHSSTSADSSIDGAQHTRANNSSSESRNTTPAPDVMAEDDPNRDDRSEEAEPGEVSDDIPVSRSSAAAETVSAVEPTVVSPASEDSSPGSGSDGDDEDEEAGAISDDAMQESDDESEPAAKTTTQQTRNASEIFSSAQSPTPDTPAPDSLHSNTQSDAMEEDDDEDYEPADTLPPIKNGTAKNAQSSSEATIDIETQAESNASQESVDASPQSSQTNDATSANYEDHDQDLPLEARYRPYKSVLRSFTNTGLDADRSATDASKIDPNIPLCQYEMSGGICNDSDCEDQHFEPRAVKDSDTIKKLGLSNPGKTQKERDDYHMGLFDLMTDLKLKQADAGHVIKEVTRFRQRFVQDPPPGSP